MGKDQSSLPLNSSDEAWRLTDNTGLLDTPQLVNVALTAPYLHDGSARSLEEIWTVFNPEDKHGRTKDELNDLIECLRTR